MSDNMIPDMTPSQTVNQLDDISAFSAFNLIGLKFWEEISVDRLS